jgi:cytoskeleton protein RodZ
MTRADADNSELAASPGTRLRLARESHGLTEQQAAEAINLDPMVVTALEANDFPALGAPVFVRGHLRRYAGFLGLPEDEIVSAYERSKQQVGEPSLVPRARLEMEPVRGRPRWPWVVGGTAAFLLAAVLVAYLSEHGLPGLASGDDQAAGENPAPAPESAQSGSRTVAAPGVAAPEGRTGTAPATPGQVNLQLKFSGDSWVEVFDGSGKAVIYDLGKAGSERTVSAAAPISVTLGNAASVRVTVNGREVAPPRLADAGTMTRFSIAGDGSVH